MKIIDLLNKIANGEEVPEEIKYNNINYYWCNQCKIYERIEDERKDLYNDLDNLNDEVEIIEYAIEEEKKIPEKLSTWFSVETKQSKELNIEYANTNFENMYEKINEIIDYLKSKGE